MDDREVVADEQIGEPQPPLQVLHQVQDLRLHRDVERRGRLVADQELRLGSPARARSRCAGAGRRRTRAGTSRRRPAQADLAQQLARRCLRRSALSLAQAEGADRLGDDVAHAPARIEAGVRVLEDHLHPPAQRRVLGAGCGWSPCRCRRTRSCPRSADRGRRRGARPSTCRSPIRRPARSVSPLAMAKSTPSTACTIWRGRALEQALQPRRARRRSSASGPSICDELRHRPAPSRQARRRLASSCSQQAARAVRRPPSARAARPGSARTRCGQRGLKAQPGGIAVRRGIEPSICASRSPRSPTIAGSSPSGPRCRDAAACLITSRTGPISTMRPAYITATRSAVSAITPMSCVTSITAVPCSRQSRFSSAMICAWIETSSAVVGSSATISARLGAQRQRDHHALAHAAGELVRIVVDALLGAGDADLLQQLDARAARAAAVDSGRCVWIVSIELAADRVERVERWSAGPGRSRRCARRGSGASPRTAGCRCAGPRAGSRRRRCGPAARAGR